VWLALRRGETVSECKARVPESDFRVFWEYFRHVPLPEDRFEFWCARLLAAASNPWRSAGSPAAEPKDLIPDWWKDPAPPERTLADWRLVLRGMAG
jgi:hypothetical protein